MTLLQILYDFDRQYPDSKDSLTLNWRNESAKILFLAQKSAKKAPPTLTNSVVEKLEDGGHS